MVVHPGKACYAPPNADNPFMEGQDRAYADILQDKINETRRWRLVGFGTLAAMTFQLCILLFVIASQKTIPVLINVMPSGEAAYLGEVRQNAPPQVPEAAIMFQIRKFITNLRQISTDAEVLYNNIDDCYAMITSSYDPVLTRSLRSASPFNLVGKIRRTPDIESVIKITGASYQADWIEQTIEGGGSPKKKRFRALITIRLVPATDQTIKRNPLGIYIDACEITEISL